MMQARWTKQLGVRRLRCRAGRRWSLATPAAVRAQDDAVERQLDLEPRTADLERLRPRARPAQRRRAGDRIPRALAAGGAADPRPAAAAGQGRAAKTPPGRSIPTSSAAKERADAKKKTAGNAIAAPSTSRARRSRRTSSIRRAARPAARRPTAPPRRHPAPTDGKVYAVRARLFRRAVQRAGLGLRRATRTRPGPSPTSRRATALTAPPPGYQTPSAAQPYGVDQARSSSTPVASSSIPAGAANRRAAIEPHSTGSCGAIPGSPFAVRAERPIQEACRAPCDEARRRCARHPDILPCLRARARTAPAPAPRSPISPSPTGSKWS